MCNSKFLSGVAVGMLIGVLFAPDKGKNTRNKIVSLKGKVKDFAGEVADNVEGLKNDVSDIINSGKSKIDQWTSGPQGPASYMGDRNDIVSS